jgi:hypothetical protein
MRTIIESNALARQFRQYEVQRALRIAPETFPQVPNTSLYRVKLIGFDGVPPLSIFFTFDENTVTLHFAAIFEEEE